MAKAPIDRKEVIRVAGLAHLGLSDAEIGEMGEQLNAIVASMADLDPIDTRDIEPTAHPLAMDCPLRDDVPRPSLRTREVLAAAPATAAQAFSVPRILDTGE